MSDPQEMHREKICINTNLLPSARKIYSLYHGRGKTSEGGKTKKKQELLAVLNEKLKAGTLLNAKKMASLERREPELQPTRSIMRTDAEDVCR